MEKVVINACPICLKQGKKTFMEGSKGSEDIKCAVHGEISLKYWHDIFIEPFYEKNPISNTGALMPRITG